MATSVDTLRNAVAHHQAGRLREAEQLYRQVLEVDPRHADALHLLGLVAHQCSRNETAVELISRAILLAGNHAVYHSNLGEVYRALGRLDEACQSFRKALELKPDYPEAHNNLGNVLSALGQAAEAEASYQQALRWLPTYADPLNNLGLLRQARGDAEGALAFFRRALEINPQSATALNNLAVILKQRGKLAEAIAMHQQALEKNPHGAELHANLAALYQGEKDYENAARHYRESLRLNPYQPQTQHNLGASLKELGQCEEALAAYREALRLKPDLAETYGNMGIVLNELGQREAAYDAYREALRLKPDDATMTRDYGAILESHGRFDEAFEMFQRALALRPDFAEAYFNLGSVFQSKRLAEQAIAAYERALALKPDDPAVLNNLSVLYCDMSQPDRALEYAERGIELAPHMGALYANRQIALHAQGRSQEAIDAGLRAVELRPEDAAEYSNYLYTLNFHPRYDAETIFREHLKWARLHAEPLTALAAPHLNDRSPDRLLRIGYLSPYFRQHAVNFFVEPILASHDHEQFEIVCYADMMDPDATTARLKQSADRWYEVPFVSDDELARKIREDQIDILVDLTGHIGGNRMLLFARKPAPVQVTYIGYQNTTGMSAMDYRLTDERADPPGMTERYHTERLVRLPRSFFCYQPSADAPAVSPLPAMANGYITFGSFNNFAKVTPEVRQAWWRILNRVPDSRLMVLAYRGGYLEAELKRDAAACGIDASRIELFNKRPRLDYLALLGQADIALDPFPFNGHTTTCDAIWQGVPVVMLEGQTYVSRFGASVLANVGLESLIAQSVDGYVEIAAALADDRDRLVALRGSLRATMAASPLLDYAGFTRNLEQAYREMWHAWCRTPQGSGSA